MKSSLATIPIILLTKITLLGAQPILTDDNTLRRLVGLSVELNSYEVLPAGEAEHLVEMTGMDRTWDVSMLAFREPTAQSTYYTAPEPGMPNIDDPRLVDANVAAITDPSVGTWTYQRLDDMGQYLLGRVTLKDVNQDGRKDTLLNVFDPVSLVFPFPLTMGTSWTDSTTQTLEFQGSPPVPVETVVSSNVVEGWGTLVSPDGMSPALRIRTDAQVTSAGGQKSRRRTIRLVAPVPDGLVENMAYAARVEMRVDSLDELLAFDYVSLSARRPISTEPPELPAADLDVRPNYPNPFRETTTIPFIVDVPTRVRISVFDIVGRRVAEILDETLHPGSYQATWNAGNVPSGIYRVLVETRSAAASRHVVVVK